MESITNNLSKHLFWEVDSAELNHKKHAKYIIAKVLQYGFIQDWEILLAHYGIKKITDIAIKMRNLDKKTASFLALIADVSKQKFICYTTKQSTLKHWNF